ncbi:hypothetical protein NBRC110019_14270 [Neptunitalea chrysea]|uniref:HTH luxR-type domain-containing protein n=2 Tax=Neptunitalea chrysea TaxID=1647581 RepID=A0A9W6EVD4_9FLAO|nr:hypothetical protein NBRC110019_14270 [Neptunitalea chrysea]
MDSAYIQLNELINEAVETNKHNEELILLDRKCHYLYNITDLNNLLTTSQELEKKAIKYKKPVYQAAANLYLSESYSMNDMQEKALECLNIAEKLIEKAPEITTNVFYIKSNILLSQGNIYYDKKEYNKAIAKIKTVIKSGKLLTDSIMYNQFQFVNYSNLANIYLKINIDSAKYYVHKSIALESQKYSQLNITGSNFYVLGKVNQHENNIPDALRNYKKSYHIIEEYGDGLIRSDLYRSLQEVYTELGKADSAKIYGDKLKEYELLNLQNKYKSLKTIIKETDDSTKESEATLLLIIGVAVIVILIISILLIYFLRKRKLQAITPIETEQEKLAKNYDKLLELIKKDDPAFLSNFEEIFPDFRNNLLAINTELNISEITFCALLKLNLSTKKIAQLTFIETRTVQNKKHRIRKKLSIPKEIDTYNWFNSI